LTFIGLYNQGWSSVTCYLIEFIIAKNDLKIKKVIRSTITTHSYMYLHIDKRAVL